MNPAPAPAPQRSAPWYTRDFLLFWTGQGLSNLGDACAMVALPLLAFEATGSVLQMGAITAISTLGRLAMGVLAGVVLDRTDRRRFMIALDVGRAAVYALIPIVWQLAGPQLWLLYVASIAGASLGAAFRVAYPVAVPALVEREHLHAANGALEATYALAYILGPLAAGALAALYGPVWAIALDAGTFVVSALSLALIRFRPYGAARPAGARPSDLRDYLEGLRCLWRLPVLRTVALLVAGLQLVVAGSYDLFVFYLRHDLAQSSDTVGIVFGVASLGGVAAGLLAGRLRRALGANVCFLLSLALQGICLIALALTTVPVLFTSLIIAVAFGDTLKSVLSQTLRQQAIPDHLLGRTSSAFWLITAVPAPLGAAVVTAAASALGAVPALIGVGVIILALAGAGLLSPARKPWPDTPESLPQTFGPAAIPADR